MLQFMEQQDDDCQSKENSLFDESNFDDDSLDLNLPEQVLASPTILAKSTSEMPPSSPYPGLDLLEEFDVPLRPMPISKTKTSCHNFGLFGNFSIQERRNSKFLAKNKLQAQPETDLSVKRPKFYEDLPGFQFAPKVRSIPDYPIAT